MSPSNLLPDGTPIGCVAFLDYDADQRKAELRKLVGDPAQRGKGYGKEASALWIRYGLTTLGLKKIYLNTLETNIHNVHLNEELGFRVEGILRPRRGGRQGRGQGEDEDEGRHERGSSGTRRAAATARSEGATRGAGA